MLQSNDIVRKHFADPAWEGEFPYMYLDSVNNVTVGIGCLLRSVAEAQALKFVYRHDQAREKDGQQVVVARQGDAASGEEIAADFKSVRAESGQGWRASAFEKVTRLDLPTAEIDRIFFDRVATFEKQIKGHLPDYDRYPAPAQLALLDMAFNLGTNGLMTKFPKLIQAAKDRKWAIAAAQCHRASVSAERNRRTAELFSEAADDEKSMSDERAKLAPRSVDTRRPATLPEPEWLPPLIDTIHDFIEKLRPLLAPRRQGGG
jgi:GH24 family phage-related lysozyme (muramidase)